MLGTSGSADRRNLQLRAADDASLILVSCGSKEARRALELREVLWSGSMPEELLVAETYAALEALLFEAETADEKPGLELLRQWFERRVRPTRSTVCAALVSFESAFGLTGH